MLCRFVSRFAQARSTSGYASRISSLHRSGYPKPAVPGHAYSQLRCRTTGETEIRPNIIKISNGEKVKPTFSKAEMDSRLAKLRSHMEKNSIEGALFSSYTCINYYSDFLYLAFGRPYGLVVTPEKVVVIASLIDYGQPERRNHVGETLLYTDWTKGNFWKAVQQELGHIKGKVGCEFDDLPADDYKKLLVSLPVARLVDIAETSMHQRLIKSPEEIVITKEAARIADIGGEVAFAAMAEGVPEYEVALASTDAMVREIARTFPHHELRDMQWIPVNMAEFINCGFSEIKPESIDKYDVSCYAWSWIQGGINTDGGHNAVTSRKFKNGDIGNINCFPIISGYYAALERTVFIKHASDENLRLWEANCEVHRRGMELIRPGVKCSDIAHELNEIYRKHDLLHYRTFGYGHSFGILSHYYGREAALEFREDVETALQPNMVVSMEPMITIPEGQAGAGGYREHNILVVTETGAENITHFPFGPEHNITKK